MSSGKRILVVDDEVDIQTLLRYNLEREGFSVETVEDGISALKRLRDERFDLLILDLMLPEMDGLELCRTLRHDEGFSRLPIIMLTAKDDEVDRVLGLEMGADDYVTKPFSPREVVARVKAVLRRISEAQQPSRKTILKFGDLSIDTERFTVTKKGKEIELSAREFKLLIYLAERPGRVFSRTSLLDAVWGDEVFVEPRTVDVYIRRLREKIEDDPSKPRYILTKRGIGYYFSEKY